MNDQIRAQLADVAARLAGIVHELNRLEAQVCAAPRSVAAIPNPIQRQGKRWSSSEDQQLLSFRSAGQSTDFIAATMGRTVFSVCKRLDDLEKRTRPS